MIRCLLTIAVAQAAAWWHLDQHAAASGVVALAAVALAGAVVAVLAQACWPGAAITAGPLRRRAVGLRRKSWGAVFQRQRNPDAAGRARPRAPAAASTAA
jgi:hypothetical protein